MDFTLDKKYEMAQTLFKDFAQNEVKLLHRKLMSNTDFQERL